MDDGCVDSLEYIGCYETIFLNQISLLEFLGQKGYSKTDTLDFMPKIQNRLMML